MSEFNQHGRTRTYKVVLAGDGGVGKTTFIQKYIEAMFPLTKPSGWNHSATLGNVVHPLQFDTASGTVVFDLWDTAGIDSRAGSRENFYKDADAAIIMFSLTSETSYANLQKWYSEIRETNPSIPVLIVGNKCDAHDRIDIPITFPNKNGLAYFEMSAKKKINLYTPCVWISTVLAGADTSNYS